MTSPLPRGCSTTELAGPIQKPSVVTFRHHDFVIAISSDRERETGFEPATFSLEG